MEDVLLPIVTVGSALGTTCFLAWVILEILRSRQHIRATTELQGKLIDRLGAQDIGMFLTSENGAQLLGALADQTASGDQAHVRILRALQSGLVLLVLGISLFLYAGTRTLPGEGEDAAMLFATLATALGVGLLLAAGASYRLSRRMGLLKTEDDSPAAV